jgi:hypothetical protein
MSNELFTELSVEEQEVVAGGIDFTFTGTRFDAKLSTVKSISASGPLGTTSGSEGTDTRVGTGGNTLTALVSPVIVAPPVPVVIFP